MTKKLRALLLMLVFLGCATTALAQQDESLSRSVSEKLLGAYDRSIVMEETLTVSPNNRQLAYIAKKNKQRVVVLNDKEGKPFDDIGKLYQTQDKVLHFSLSLLQDESKLIFSPDSKRLAYKAKVGNKWVAVIDGNEESPYDDIAGPIFSPNSKSYAYMAKAGTKWTMVFDGKAQKLYDNIQDPAFSADDSRFGYTASENHKGYAVIDGKEYEGDGVVFSATGKQAAYRVSTNSIVVIEGNQQKPVSADKPHEGVSSFDFSADGKRWFYVAKTGKKCFVVVDGKTDGREYQAIGRIGFSPDSQHFAYVGTNFSFLKNKAFVIVDGQEQSQYQQVVRLQFSPDSKRLSYVTYDYAILPVVDGFALMADKNPNYEAINNLVFSPDSKHVAYGTVQYGDEQIAIDSRRPSLKKYNFIAGVVFTPDSKRVVYGALTGKFKLSGKLLLGAAKSYKAKVVIDSNEGQEYDGIFPNQDSEVVVFDALDAFHYIVVRGTNFYLIEEKITDKQAPAAPTPGQQDHPVKLDTSTPSSPSSSDLLSGQWEGKLEGQGQSMPFSLNLKLEGGNITGEMTSMQGGKSKIDKIIGGNLVGNLLTLLFATNQPKYPMKMTALLDNDKLAGDATIDKFSVGRWEANRKK